MRLIYRFSPTFCIARGICRFCMNQRQTFPVRMFSALNRIIPTLIPITSVSTQPVFGLNASTKPYRP